MKTLNYISYIVLLIAFGVLILIGYWLLYPYKIVEFKDTVFPVMNKVVKRGQLVTYTSNYCKYMDKPAIVTRTFKNELIFLSPSTITNRPLGCNTIVVSVLVPSELPVGKYFMEQVYQFEVNPLRKITIIENTEEFEVVE